MAKKSKEDWQALIDANRVITAIIPRKLIDSHPEEVVAFMNDILVMRTEYNYVYNAMEYTGYSDLVETPQFGTEPLRCRVERVGGKIRVVQP